MNALNADARVEPVDPSSRSRQDRSLSIGAPTLLPGDARFRAYEVAQLRAWLLDPQPAIAIEAITRFVGQLRVACLGAVAYGRAIAEADATDAVWTPLLDLIDLHHLWPQSSDEARQGGAAYFESAPHRAGRIASRLRAADGDPHEVDKLLDYRGPSLRAAIARFAPRLSPKAATDLLHSEHTAQELARNRALDPESRARVAALAWETVQRLRPSPEQPTTSVAHIRRANSMVRTLWDLAARHGLDEPTRASLVARAQHDGSEDQRDALFILLQDTALPSDELARLAISVQSRAQFLAEALLHPAATDDLWEKVLESSDVDAPALASTVLGSARPCAPRRIDWLFGAVVRNGQILDTALARRFVSRAETPLNVLRAIAATLSDPDTIRALAAHAVANRDALIAARLETSPDAAALWTLYDVGTPTRRPAVLRRLARIDPRRVVTMLGRLSTLEPSHREVISALLATADHEVWAQTRDLIARHAVSRDIQLDAGLRSVNTALASATQSLSHVEQTASHPARRLL